MKLILPSSIKALVEQSSWNCSWISNFEEKMHFSGGIYHSCGCWWRFEGGETLKTDPTLSPPYVKQPGLIGEEKQLCSFPATLGLGCCLNSWAGNNCVCCPDQHTWPCSGHAPSLAPLSRSDQSHIHMPDGELLEIQPQSGRALGGSFPRRQHGIWGCVVIGFDQKRFPVMKMNWHKVSFVLDSSSDLSPWRNKQSQIN